MEIKDSGFVIELRNYAGDRKLVRILSKTQGIWKGVTFSKGGISLFDEVDFIWKSKSLDNLGLFNIDIKKNHFVDFFYDERALLCLKSVSVLLNVLAYLSNSLLLISWLPVLITGIVLFARNLEIIEFDLLWTGYFIGLICGVLFHEFGHAFAGISYGAKVFEMGVMLMYRILPGAYVLLDVSTVKKRLQRIQINAAGVEMNFLLCGIFLVLGVVNPLLGGMFLNAAICNAFLGALNLTFIKGLDGAAILSNLLGVDDIIDRARRIVFNREARKRVIRKGSSGYATVAVCYMLFALQIALPTLLITNVLEIISCFV